MASQPATPTPATSQSTFPKGKALPPEDEPEEETEDIEKQKKEGDYSGEYGKRVYCRRHFHSMTPLRLLFIVAGRFPFSCSAKKDGTYSYKFIWGHPFAFYFLFMTLLILYIIVVGTYAIAHIALNFTVYPATKDPGYEEQRKFEEVLIKRYYIPLIFVFTSLFHGFIASVLVMKKRHYIAHYLTFWSKAVYTMHMDCSRLGLGFSVRVTILTILISIGLTLMAIFKVGSTPIGLPTVFGDLLFRLFIKNYAWLESETPERMVAQFAGAIILILAFVASKSAILLFIYHCKLIQSAFAFWNGRVYAAVLRGGEYAQTDEGRTTYKLLFKDYCVLMDLMEGMDQVFAFTMESYFGCQVCSLFFELYFCIRTAKHGDNRGDAAYPTKNNEAFFVRPRDWAPGFLMLFLSTSLMLSAAKSAADVAEEAMAGLEVIRRKTMLGRKSDDELYFMLSMFSSYTAYKKMELTGGGYYYMNKDFIIGLISNALSYFIILYQFQPVMDKSFPGVHPTREERIRYGQYLQNIEGLEDDHYDTTPIVGDPWDNFRNR
ncbi:unnamed protein product [Orchesella dallaii]|uniref:Uncharacterized protein n=1 Tax=Orchesella dallaii TaxID=48710 RepID=A0ABP1QQ04_9HEXA